MPPHAKQDKGKSVHKAVKRNIVSYFQPSQYIPQNAIRISPKTALSCELSIHQYVTVKYGSELIWLFIDSLDPSLKKTEVSISITLKDYFELDESLFLVLKREEPQFASQITLKIQKVGLFPIYESIDLHNKKSNFDKDYKLNNKLITNSNSFINNEQNSYEQNVLSPLHLSIFREQINTFLYDWIFQLDRVYTIPLRLVEGILFDVTFKILNINVLVDSSSFEEKSAKSAKYNLNTYQNVILNIVNFESKENQIKSNVNLDQKSPSTLLYSINHMLENNQLKNWITNVNKSFPGYEKIVQGIIETFELSSRSFYNLKKDSKNSYHQSNTTSMKVLKNLKSTLHNMIRRCALLSGSSGVGKTFLTQQIARNSPDNWKFINVNATYLFSGDIGQSEKNINEEFQKAILLTEYGKYKVILVIDQLEAIGLNKSMLHASRIEKLVIVQLINNIKKLSSSSYYVGVLGITNDESLLDASLKEVGFFDTFFELKVPSLESREKIFENLLSNEKHLLNTLEIKNITLSMHGMIAADMKKVIEEAKSISKQNYYSSNLKFNQIINITIDHLNKALENIQPSLLIGRELKFKTVKLTEMAGIDHIIKQINFSIIEPMSNRRKFLNLGIQPPKGVLLTGPSGVGKTTLAAAIATEVKANFISVQCPDIISKIVGSSSRAIASLFKQARACAPCVLFFDQFEAIARNRSSSSSGHFSDQMLSTLLIEMDGVYGLNHSEAPILVLAASNRLDLLDPAVLRPGRMDQHIRLELPDFESRLEILKKKTSTMPLNENVDLNLIALRTNGYSGALLENICREAAMLALRENIEASEVNQKHFMESLSLSFKNITFSNSNKRYKKLF